jgi:serine phosphatase RsbU (regulator of sigma subunit)
MHSIVHTAAAVQLPPLNVLMDHLNTYLMTNFSGISYATCALLRLDLENGTIECLNAGHLPPIIIARDGTPRRMPIGDHMPLGLDGQEWIIQQDRLEEGEWLGLTTDGVTELTRSDGSMLRLDGWEQTLRECVQKLQPTDGASELASKLMTTLDVQGENATPQDDRTFLVARRRSAPTA